MKCISKETVLRRQRPPYLVLRSSKDTTNGKSLWEMEIAGPSWNDGAGGSLEKQTAVGRSTQSFLS